MNINTEETISLITVKMEGVSRTRLPIPREDQRDSKRAEVEIHRVGPDKCTNAHFCKVLIISSE